MGTNEFLILRGTYPLVPIEKQKEIEKVSVQRLTFDTYCERFFQLSASILALPKDIIEDSTKEK